MSPLRHCRSIASGRIDYGDAVLTAVVEVDVIGADSGCADELYCSALEKGLVAMGASASEQHLGVAQHFIVYLAARHIVNLMSHRLK